MKYITYEQAKWLKEKGYEFDFGVDFTGQHHVVDWLLEKHDIWIYIVRDGGWWIPVIQDLSNEKEQGTINIDMTDVPVCFNSPQEAYSSAFDYIRENIVLL